MTEFKKELIPSAAQWWADQINIKRAEGDKLPKGFVSQLAEFFEAIIAYAQVSEILFACSTADQNHSAALACVASKFQVKLPDFPNFYMKINLDEMTVVIYDHGELSEVVYSFYEENKRASC